jgi:hypothetical protein
MRQVRLWLVASIAGVFAGSAAWTALEIIGHEPVMASGLGVGAGVGVAALTGRWMEKRHEARQRLARFLEGNNQ